MPNNNTTDSSGKSAHVVVSGVSVQTPDSVAGSNTLLNSIADSVPSAAAVRAGGGKSVQVTVVSGLRFSSPS
jgi:hypothetical protein